MIAFYWYVLCIGILSWHANDVMFLGCQANFGTQKNYATGTCARLFYSLVQIIPKALHSNTPVGARGVKSRMCPPCPQRDRKRRLNGAVCLNHRTKRVVPCRCWDGHVEEPYEMSMALGARP